MRSSLSHNTCRQLVVCHGLPARTSALSISSRASSRPACRPRPLYRHATRRTFLNKLFNAPREVQDSGFGDFIKLHNRTVQGTQLPGREELIKSFRIFFNAKLRRKTPVNQIEAAYAAFTLRHLSEGGPEEPRPPIEDLRTALSALVIRARRRQHGNHIVQLATLLYDQIRSASLLGANSIAPANQSQHRLDQLSPNDELRFNQLCSDDLKLYVTVLTKQGAPQKAAELLTGFKDLTPHFSLDRPNELSDLHLMVVHSFAEERNPAVKEYANDLEAAGFPYFAEIHEALTIFYTSDGQANEGELRQCFQKPIADEQMARPGAYLALIKYSTAKGNTPKWLLKALQNLCDLNPPKAWWDIILQWAVYQGKDINHIKHMINVFSQLNEHDESIRADITTINGLITAALDKRGVLLAERIFALASELGLRPDTQTQTLLLQARIAGNDTAGAASAFEEIILSSQVVPGSDTEEALNQYVKYLCSEKTEPKSLLNVLSRFESKGGQLEPETVVSVCSHFLKNDNAVDVTDTLSLHLKRFSIEERLIVQESLKDYCLSKETSTARAWSCYNVLRRSFHELRRTERIQLMNGFLDRKRADMAARVFGHMRAHPSDNIRPDLDSYVAFFEGFSTCPDEDSLQVVHNMLKMDALIQPNTRLYNALMLAYTADEQPTKAFGFFQQITNSAEGPSYESLEIVFRTCEIMSNGYERAKAIWDKIQRLEVDVPLQVFDAYLMMMAGQGRIEDVKNLIASRITDYDAQPKSIMLGHIYNALRSRDDQRTFKEWASLEYAANWKVLTNRKLFQTQQGTDRYLIPPKKLKA